MNFESGPLGLNNVRDRRSQEDGAHFHIEITGTA